MRKTSWKNLLARRLPLLGHRNWIGVVDSAYPLQTASGIETVATNAGHLAVLKTTFDAIQRATHVRPLPYLDSELVALPEANASGIGSLREGINSLLKGEDVVALPHEEMISRLDEAARRFQIVLFKTTLSLPYTSVFFELDCGYWSEASERALRTKLSKKKNETSG